MFGPIQSNFCDLKGQAVVYTWAYSFNNNAYSFHVLFIISYNTYQVLIFYWQFVLICFEFYKMYTIVDGPGSG